MAAAAATGLGLWAGAAALAQQAEPAAPPGEGRKELGAVVETRSEGNEEAAKVQARIDTISDETDELLAKFRTTLKQIDAIDLYNRQMRDLVAAQQAELASLIEQLDRVDEVGRNVTPLMIRMIEAIDAFVALDVPFLLDERSGRIAELRKMMGRADVTTPEKFRQIMEAYQLENEYGRTIEAYRDTVDIDGRETTVDFLRFGRIALVYQSLDESETGAWDQTARSWMPLDSSYRSAIRDGLRIARKQAAPDLIRLPLPAPSSPRGES
jgi:hypothetical protein